MSVKKKKVLKITGVQSEPKTTSHWCGGGGWVKGWRRGGVKKKIRKRVDVERVECASFSPAFSPTGGVCGQLHFIKTAAPPPPYTVGVIECIHVCVCVCSGVGGVDFHCSRKKGHSSRIQTENWLLLFFFKTLDTKNLFQRETKSILKKNKKQQQQSA